jgi:hypothetical protein
MLAVLIACIVAIIIGAIAIWLLSFLTLDPKLMQLARGLIIIFVVCFVIFKLLTAAKMLPG